MSDAIRPLRAPRRGASLLAAVAALAGLAGLTACVPDEPAVAPTRLAILTQLTWCGGVVPPPGEPWCHTSPTSATVDVWQGRVAVQRATSGTDGSAVVDVEPGTYVVAAVDPPGYMTCDHPSVTVAAGQTAPVVQTCTVFAP